MTIRELQTDVGEWSRKNFPRNSAIEPALGLVEEVGELFHAILKQRQGIRGTYEEHEEAKRDAVGDIVIYLCDYCERSGFDLEEVVEQVWQKVVKKRNWTAAPQDGLMGESSGTIPGLNQGTNSPGRGTTERIACPYCRCSRSVTPEDAFPCDLICEACGLQFTAM